jgi:hypothetical protein
MAHDSYQAEYRTQQAIEMRSMGVDYDFIAKELGYSDRSGAWRAVQRGMKRSTAKKIEDLRWATVHELTRIADSLDTRLVLSSSKSTEQLLRLVNTKVEILNFQECQCSSA